MLAATRRFAEKLTMALIATVLLIVLVSLAALASIRVLAESRRGAPEAHMQAALDTERLRAWLLTEVGAEHESAATRSPQAAAEANAARAAFVERLAALRTSADDRSAAQLLDNIDRGERDLQLALEREHLAPSFLLDVARGDVRQRLAAVQTDLDALVSYEQRQADRARFDAQASLARSQRIVELGAIAAICVAAGIAILLVWRLSRSFESAQEAIQTRERFLSFATEELRRPLSSLANQIETGRVEAAGRHVVQLNALVNELLEASRLQSGKLTLQREPIDLTDLVRDVERRFQPELAVTGAAVVVQANRPAPGVWDRERLEEVIAHLLKNALQHSRGKVVRIVVEPGDPTRLVVRDHGRGLSKAELDHVFNAYEGGLVSHRPGSLGLGLFIVRRIVEAHGGSIRVETTPAVGTTFIVELPQRPPLPRRERRRPWIVGEPSHA